MTDRIWSKQTYLTFMSEIELEKMEVTYSGMNTLLMEYKLLFPEEKKVTVGKLIQYFGIPIQVTKEELVDGFRLLTTL